MILIFKFRQFSEATALFALCFNHYLTLCRIGSKKFLLIYRIFLVGMRLVKAGRLEIRIPLVP
jgi:hypothetical protein